MEERLTERYKDFRCPKCGEVISSASDVEFYQSRLQAQPEIAKALAKLAHYEDLEEQGKLVILQKPIGRVTFDQFNDEGGTHDTSTND